MKYSITVQAVLVLAALVAASVVEAAEPRKPSPEDVPVCPDIAPPSEKGYTCAEQEKFGKCSNRFMKGFCLMTCGGCPLCSDISYDDVTCEEHAKNENCDAEEMDGGLYCQKSCDRCLVLPPPSETKKSDDGKTTTEVTTDGTNIAAASATGDRRATKTTVSDDGSVKSVSVSMSG